MAPRKRKLPGSTTKFAGPKIGGRSSFPIGDVKHDVLAKQFVGRAIRAGHITRAQGNAIVASANKDLKSKGKK